MQVVGLDNLCEYYDVGLKNARLDQLREHRNFKFVKLELNDRDAIAKLFEDQRFDSVVHLGAQAGVRYSIENPFVYADSNVMGTLTILEGCRPLDYDFSPPMDHGEGLTWLSLNLPKRFLKGKPSMFTTKGK